MKNELKWKALSERLGKHGEEICSAMKELYSVFGPEIVDWYASLYDPCHGMWYHARSAQENEGYLPDIESLCDAAGFLQEMGATEGKAWYEIFPDWLKEKIGKFVYGLQDEDGYFYHPQWGKEIGNLRKSRDLGTCIRFLRYLGITPKYKIPIATSDDEEPNYDLKNAPIQFRSVENYRRYLSDMDFVNKAYRFGSELSSCMGEVETYSKLLGEDLVKITLDTLTSYQRPDNGIWHPEANHYGGNGAQKIAKIFNWYDKKLPYQEKGIESLMTIINSDEVPDAVVQVYNPWHALASFIKNVEITGATKEEMDALMEKIYRWAPEAIRQSAKQIRLFKQADGALSYLPNCSCYTKCGAPCAVPETAEGDVNGTSCGSAALIASIYAALNVTDYAVPVYSFADMERFLSIVEARELDYQERQGN